MAGTIWLCPIKLRSWNIIKKRHVYGLPCGRKRKLENLGIGDLLVIYVYPPVAGIVGVCEVTSKPFIGYESLWGKSSTMKVKYPCRINVKPIPNLVVEKSKAVPLYVVLGYANHMKGLVVEPYLHNILFTKLTKEQSKIILNELSKYSTRG